MVQSLAVPPTFLTFKLEVLANPCNQDNPTPEQHKNIKQPVLGRNTFQQEQEKHKTRTKIKLKMKQPTLVDLILKK